MNEHLLIATRTPADNPNRRLGRSERTLSLAAGGALVFSGLRSGGLGGLLQIGLGAYGLVRGATGKCAVKNALAHTPFDEAFEHAHGWNNSESVTRSITISKPMMEVIAFIRAPQNVGPLIPWVDNVEATSDDTSVWTASAPLGQTLRWSLKLEDEQDQSLHWRSEPNSSWEHDVRAHFKDAPAGRGTEVKLVIVGKPAIGKIGYAMALALAQFTDKVLLNLLHSIKQKLETGEVSTHTMRPEQADDFFYVHPQSQSSVTASSAPMDAVKTSVVIGGGIA